MKSLQIFAIILAFVTTQHALAGRLTDGPEKRNTKADTRRKKAQGSAHAARSAAARERQAKLAAAVAAMNAAKPDPKTGLVMVDYGLSDGDDDQDQSTEE